MGRWCSPSPSHPPQSQPNYGGVQTRVRIIPAVWNPRFERDRKSLTTLSEQPPRRAGPPCYAAADAVAVGFFVRRRRRQKSPRRTALIAFGRSLKWAAMKPSCSRSESSPFSISCRVNRMLAAPVTSRQLTEAQKLSKFIVEYRAASIQVPQRVKSG